MAYDASFLKHYHTPVIHFGALHFKNEETLYYSAGPISRCSPENIATPYFVSTAEFTLHVAGFLLGIFFRGRGKIYCYANFYCYAIVFGPNFRRGKSFQGGKLPQGLPPRGRKPT